MVLVTRFLLLGKAAFGSISAEGNRIKFSYKVQGHKLEAVPRLLQPPLELPCPSVPRVLFGVIQDLQLLPHKTQTPIDLLELILINAIPLQR